MCFSVQRSPEMLQSESYKRRMMAVMSLEVVCLAKEEYWQHILSAGDVKFINYLLLMLCYTELYYSQLISLRNIFSFHIEAAQDQKSYKSHFSKNYKFINIKLLYDFSYSLLSCRNYLYLHNLFFKLKTVFVPWLVWLSGLSAGLRTKGSLVQFPVRAHAGLLARSPVVGM